MDESGRPNDQPLLSKEELAQKLAVALNLPIDFRSIAEAMNCLPDDDPRRLRLSTLFSLAAQKLADGDDVRDTEWQILKELGRLLQ
jgi:hypothetical protein